MRIDRLRVENIRSYLAADLELGGGTTLIAGDVGAGKTSLLYSIEMALFGFAEVEPAYLVRHLARRAEVALTLADDGRTFELRRRFARRVRKGRDTFEVEESSLAADGARTRYSATELRQRAIDLLGFPDNPNPRAHSDFWRWAVYIPQERMRDVLLQEPAERLETVRKALGLEQYRVAADNASDLATELRRTSDAREDEADRLRHWEDEWPRWTEVREHRAAELARLRAEEDERRDVRDRADAAVREAEDARRRREAAERERSRLREERDALTTEADRWRTQAARHSAEAERLRTLADEAVRRRTALDGRASEVPSWRTRLERVRDELSELEVASRELAAARADRDAARLNERAGTEEVEVARREAEIARESRTALEQERPIKEPPAPTPRTPAEIADEIDRVRAETDAALAKVADLNRIARDLEELLKVGTCPRCGQAVRPDDHRRHWDEARAALSEEEGRLEERRTRARDLEDEARARDRYEKAHLKWEEVEKRRASAREAQARAEDRLRRTEERMLAAREALRAAESRVSALEARARPLAERLQERDRLEARLREWDQIAPEISRLAERARASVEQARVQDESAERARDTARSAAARAEALGAELSALEAGLREPEVAEARLRDLERERSAAQAALEETVARAATADAERQEAERRIREADSGRRERAELLREAEHLRTLGDWLGREFREGVLRLERRLLAHAQADFDRLFSRYFATLIEDPNLVARCDVAFSPLVEIEGEDTPPEALSGGERTALALAFRLAMGRVVRGVGRLRLDTLILDEPTDGFSPEQVERLGELFDEVGYGQILLVSHESQLSAIADRIVRVRKEHGESSIVDEGAGPRAEAGAAGPIARPRVSPEPVATAGFVPATPRRRTPRRSTLDGDRGERSVATEGTARTLPDPTAEARRAAGFPGRARVASGRPAARAFRARFGQTEARSARGIAPEPRARRPRVALARAERS
jgi:exonuclease SbcC